MHRSTRRKPTKKNPPPLALWARQIAEMLADAKREALCLARATTPAERRAALKQLGVSFRIAGSYVTLIQRAGR